MGSYTKASEGITRIRDNEEGNAAITSWIFAVLW